METMPICSSISLGAYFIWLTSISLKPTLQEHLSPKLNWVHATGIWPEPYDGVWAVSTGLRLNTPFSGLPSWEVLELKRAGSLDGSSRGWVCLFGLCFHLSTSRTLRAWGCRLPVGQKYSDSAVFIAVSVSLQEILKENLRMFELVQKHPSHWPPFVPPAKPEVTTTGAGKWLFRCSTTSRPTYSNWFMRQKQLSRLIKKWCLWLFKFSDELIPISKNDNSRKWVQCKTSM